LLSSVMLSIVKAAVIRESAVVLEE